MDPVTGAEIRSDDGKVVIHTTNYVSHRGRKAPWKSSFSLTPDEARALRDQIDAALKGAE